jgi:Zn-dependent protease/predicted transcriptional regulator
LEAFRLGRIFGVEVRIHWSWFAIAALLVWWLADGFFADSYKDWSTGEAWAAAVVASGFFFASVLVHELAHSLTAKRLGLPVSSITLFIFGGFSSLTDEPTSAKQEFVIAIVGPALSFVLAVVFGVVAVGSLAGGWENSPPAAVAEYLAVVNFALGLFNLLPGFPLDGGRVFRAAVWARNGDMVAATRWASRSGLVISTMLIVVGVVSIFLGSFVGGAWFVVIGWFLRGAAQSSYEQLVARKTLEGVRVEHATDRAVIGVSPDENLDRVVQLMLEKSQRCIPVLVEDDLLGVVSMKDLQRVPQEEWPRTSAFRAMTPRERLHVIAPQQPLQEALEMMAANDIHQLPVLDGRSFIGFVTRADVFRLLQVRAEIRERTADRPAGRPS